MTFRAIFYFNLEIMLSQDTYSTQDLKQLASIEKECRDSYNPENAEYFEDTYTAEELKALDKIEEQYRGRYPR